MSDVVTKDDLRQFRMLLINDIRKILQEAETDEKNNIQADWLRSRAVRKLLDISSGSIQNLRVTNKVRFKKVLGSYYYNREDLKSLFNEK